MIQVSMSQSPRNPVKTAERVNMRQANMSTTIESEKQNRLSFLDVQVIPEDKIFTNSVYRKPTFSGVYTHFDRFLPSTYKFGTVYTLTNRCLRIYSSWTKSHNELVCLKEMFFENGYPEDFITALKVYGQHRCSKETTLTVENS